MDALNVDVPVQQPDAECGNYSWMAVRAGQNSSFSKNLEVCGDLTVKGKAELTGGLENPLLAFSIFNGNLYVGTGPTGNAFGYRNIADLNTRFDNYYNGGVPLYSYSENESVPGTGLYSLNELSPQFAFPFLYIPFTNYQTFEYGIFQNLSTGSDTVEEGNLKGNKISLVDEEVPARDFTTLDIANERIPLALAFEEPGVYQINWRFVAHSDFFDSDVPQTGFKDYYFRVQYKLNGATLSDGENFQDQPWAQSVAFDDTDKQGAVPSSPDVCWDKNVLHKYANIRRFTDFISISQDDIDNGVLIQPLPTKAALVACNLKFLTNELIGQYRFNLRNISGYVVRVSSVPIPPE
jgi:hypothetical protein